VWLDMSSSRSDALRKATEALEQIASMPGATSEALTAYGRALLQDDDLEAAERTLQLATTRYPVEPSAFLFYATVAERQNHPDVAREALIDYGALVPDDPESVSRSARIGALSVKMNDFDGAIEWFERAVAAAPNDMRLLAQLAEAQLRSGWPDAARETVARGLGKDPNNAQLRVLSRRLSPRT
jgi:predicted Zn-dependent protease